MRTGATDDSWEDLGLQIKGPEVGNLASYYRLLSDWVYRDNGNMRSLRKMVRDWEAGDGQFRWLLGGPSNRLSRWAWAIKKDLEQGSRLDLVTAYFSPGQGLLRRIGGLVQARRAKPDHIARQNRQSRDDRGQQAAIRLSAEAPRPSFRISAQTAAHETGDRR